MVCVFFSRYLLLINNDIVCTRHFVQYIIIPYSSSSDGPIAIYRDDLPEEYVAYWVVEFASSQYLAISSGPDTGRLRCFLITLHCRQNT